MDFLADSSVLLDILSDDPHWCGPSMAVLDAAFIEGRVYIDPVVYSEISIRFSRIEDLEEVLAKSGLSLRELPREALFLAGKAFLTYRRAGGTKSSPLPDFYIGAHAAVEGLGLLTRDSARIRAHFPRVRIVEPRPVRPAAP